MATPVNKRVQRHRESLRARGLRPLQIWVPDTGRAGFAEECRRQGRLAADADAADRELLEFMDAALADLDAPDP